MNDRDMLELIDRYFDSEITEDEGERLATWLEAGRKNRDLFAYLSIVHRQCRTLARSEADMHELLQPENQDESPDVFGGGVWQEVLDEALESRRQHEIEAKAEELLRVQQVEARRLALIDQKEQADRRPRVIVIPRAAVWGAMAAMVLLGVLLYPVLFPEQPVPAPPVAQSDPEPPDAVEPLPEAVEPLPEAVRITRTYDAVWAAGVVVGPDMPLGDTEMTLLEGFAELSYPSGVTVIVQAPATFQSLSNERFAMESGRAKCVVVPGAEGFTVATPTGDIVDLGTVFGVDTRSMGTTVNVLDGEVRVEREEGAVQQHLTEGKAARMSAGSNKIEETTPQPQLYPTTWAQVERGVKAFDMGVRLFAPPEAIHNSQFENDERIIIFKEQEGFSLPNDIPLCLDKPGRWLRFPDKSAKPVAAGTRVDSYMIHYDPFGTPEKTVLATATFVFDQPVIGVITRPDQLRDSDEVLGHRGVQYPFVKGVNSGIEGLEFAEQLKIKTKELDVVRISSDRKTVQVKFSTNNHVDQIRVITQAPSTKP